MTNARSTPHALATCIGALLAVIGATAQASEKLSCAEDRVTHAYLCFPDAKVRANGAVRSTPFFKGGPKGAQPTGYTARVHCETQVMELTDRQGVAFVRNVPTEQVGLSFVRILCEHTPVKNDPKLATN